MYADFASESRPGSSPWYDQSFCGSQAAAGSPSRSRGLVARLSVPALVVLVQGLLTGSTLLQARDGLGTRNLEASYHAILTAKAMAANPLSRHWGLPTVTLGQDNDPLDAMVLLPEATFPGALIECRAIGMFRMKDEMGGDDKVLCIPTADQRQDGITELDDLPALSLLEIEHFFAVYKDLEPGKSVEGAVWVGRTEAEKEIYESWKRARGTDFENEFTRSE